MTRRLVATILLIATALLVLYLSRGQLSLEQIVERERQLRDLIGDRPWPTFGVAFAAYVLVSVFPGSGGKSVVVGWLFGFWPALLMVVGALTVAGALAFSAARYLLRDSLQDRFAVPLARFNHAVEREGAFYLLTVRLFHLPYSLVNYTSGVSTVPLSTFVWTTGVGITPGATVMVGLGAGLPSLRELLDQGVVSLVNPVLLMALLAMGLVPLTVRWIVRKRRGYHNIETALDAGSTARGRSR